MSICVCTRFSCAWPFAFLTHECRLHSALDVADKAIVVLEGALPSWHCLDGDAQAESRAWATSALQNLSANAEVGSAFIAAAREEVNVRDEGSANAALSCHSHSDNSDNGAESLATEDPEWDQESGEASRPSAALSPKRSRLCAVS